MNKAVIVLYICLFLVAIVNPCARAECPRADFNGDCEVNIRDFAILGQQWMDAEGSADLSGSQGVDLSDLLILAEDWLERKSPVIINEFLASNSSSEPLSAGGLIDEDGDSSDWIELYNQSGIEAGLTGFYLTDDPDNLVKWPLPDVTLAPGEYRVIFASGKDRRDPTGNLHTNFQLDKDGDYLALIEGDGTTIAYSYAPDFGTQFTDVSYGLSQTSISTVLVQSSTQAKLLVPDSDDNQQIASTWTGDHEPFDDSAWKTISSGVGFDAREGSSSAENIAFGKTATQSSDWPGLPAGLATDGHLSGSSFSHTATGDFTPWWKVDLEETSFINEIVIHNRIGFLERLYNITVEILNENDVVVYTSDILNHVSEGGVPANPGTTMTLNLSDQPAGGVSGRFIKISKTPISGYAEYLTLVEVQVFGVDKYNDIASDIEADMRDISSSCYLRIPFQVDSISEIDKATLSMKYDDGFAAYLNGTLVASDNTPDPLVYDSSAQQIHLASTAEDYEISPSLFKSGTNILAIQGLNSASDDLTFFIEPELIIYKITTGDNAYFKQPTPGTTNEQGRYGFVADTKFDVDRGFYEDPFEVKIISNTPDSSIIYTLDGTEPSLTNGTIVPAANPGATPVAVVQISTTTTLRAAAFKENYYPSDIDTHTYIFLDDVIASSVMNTGITQDPRYAPHMRQALTDLPTISIVTPTDRMQQVIQAMNYPEWTYDEFPISIEWLMPDSSFDFQEDAGASRFGGHWYETHAGGPFEKWSFRIFFRKQYGAAKLKAPLFEGFDHGIPPTETFDQLDLRSGSHDMYQRGFYMSSPLTADTMLEMGNVNPHSRFVHLYINGTYWGQYNLHERWNADMVSQYVGGEKEDYESIKTKINQGGWGDMGEPYDGDGSVWDNALTMRNSYEQIKTWVDIQSYVDFMLMWMFGNSEEEYRCVGSKTAAGQPFLFWLNDPDGFTRDIGDRTGSYGPGYIFGSLVAEADPNFMTFLADRIHEHFFNGGGLTQTAMAEKLLQRCDEIETAFYAESARWGYRSPESWASARDNYINNILANRPQTLLNQLISRGLYPNVVAPIFYINNAYQHGGMIHAGDELSMSASGGTIYYTFDGTDPRMPDGQINPDALSTESGPSTDLTLIQKGSTWKYLDDGSDQGIQWRNLSFNDTSWPSGPAQLGYGDGDESTLVSFGPDENNKYITTYFRHVFHLTNPSEITNLSASLMRDDGAVVYLNGTEIIRSAMPSGSITYQTGAAGTASGGGESTYYLTNGIDPNLLVGGDNIVAVEIHQVAGTSSDISFDFELAATIDGDGETVTIPIDKTTHVKSRTFKNSQWSAINQATFAVGDLVGSLRISELMYHPTADPNSEFIELVNIGSESVNLNLVEFANGIDFVFPDIDLASNERVVVVRNLDAFNTAYPQFTGTISGQYTGSLDNDGERIVLTDAMGQTIHDYKYEDNWYELTDGMGFSLTMVDPTSTDPNLWDTKSGWRSSLYTGGTPGAAAETVLAADSIVINELLAHSHAASPDWLELYNTTGQDINIGGWFLSDNDSDDPNIMKYRIPDGTVIEAGDYYVFVEDQTFGNPVAPGCSIPFGLSEAGETVYLYSGQNDQVTGYYQAQQKFDASETGVTFGRYEKQELSGGYDFVRQSMQTQGAANSGPAISDIVITEIHYNPSNGTDYEFVKLYNRSDSPVTLMTEVTTEITPGNFLNETLPWRVEGIGFEFPANTTIPADTYIIMAKNPTMYSSAPFTVYGPYEGKLDNGGEQIELQIPGDQEYGQNRYWIPIEKIDYDDKAPWPTTPDGNRDSLQRLNKNTYGRDHTNWAAATPTL